MSDLESFIASKQKYVKLEDGQEFIGYFIGDKEIPDKFHIADDPNATTMEYSLKTLEGKLMTWTNGGMAVAIAMKKGKLGQGIKIKRIKKGVYDIVFGNDDTVPF